MFVVGIALNRPYAARAKEPGAATVETAPLDRIQPSQKRIGWGGPPLQGLPRLAVTIAALPTLP